MDYSTRMLIVLGLAVFYGCLQLLFNEFSIARLLLVVVIAVAVFSADRVFSGILSVVKAFKDAVFRTRTI